jgi:antirestriction protein
MCTKNDTPRIYVASLSDYNAGRLHGCWVDCDQDADSINAEIAAMLAASADPGAEEWAIHDAAAGIVEHGGAFAAGIANDGGLTYFDPDACGFEDCYRGEWSSLAEYAEEFAHDCCFITDNHDGWPFDCIDWERAGNELVMGGDIWTADNPAGGIWVFSAC